ncbi:MAG: hypothetical protein ACC742_02255 [Thermoanaerobaculales bacterium]
MAPRILFDEHALETTQPWLFERQEETQTCCRRQLFNTDWDRDSTDHLMLYLAEEPQIGLDFSYLGLRWQIVDYRDGWIARLVVDD